MKSPLNDEQWSRILCHRDMNQSITDIFSVASKAIARKKARKLSEFGLERGDAIDAKDDSSQFAGLLGFAAGTLSVDMPELYFHEGQGSGFQLLDTDPPAIVVGETAASLKDRMGLAYSLGQQLSLLRPGFFVKKLVTSGTELSSWLLASIKVFAPSLPVPGDLAGKVQERLSPLREALDATEMERLQGYVQAFVSKAADVNLKRWARAAEYTMDRAGLLLCGDVAVAVRVLKEQIDDKKELSRRLRELTLFTVSAEHHKLRAHLGTALEAG